MAALLTDASSAPPSDPYPWGSLSDTTLRVFSAASLALSLCPWFGSKGALWLIVWRVVQGIGGALLTANSAAILTDAFPATQRGFAIGVSVIAGMAGAFIGLIVGGVLADVD